MRKKLEVGKLLAILLLPIAVLLFVHFFGTQHFEKLNILGESVLVQNPDGSVDTVYHNVYDANPDFSYSTQSGATVTWDSLKGKTFIVSLFEFPCEGQCMRTSFGISSLAEYFRDDPQMRFLSLCTNPESLSQKSVEDFVTKYEVPKNRWYLISGDSTKINDLATSSFLFSLQKGKESFKNKTRLMIVDKNGYIREGEKSYDGTNHKDTELMSDEIKLLKMEYESGK